MTEPDPSQLPMVARIPLRRNRRLCADRERGHPRSCPCLSLLLAPGHEAEAGEGPPADRPSGTGCDRRSRRSLARRQLPQPGHHRDHDSLHPELSAGLDRPRHPCRLPGARARTDLLPAAPHRCPPLAADPPATVLVYVLAVLHSLGSGTDGASLWFTAMVVGSAVPILALLLLRYGRRPRPSARRPIRSRPNVAANPTP